MAKIRGTNSGNTLTGTSGADSISGLGGPDTLSGLAGADKLDGGDGGDTLIGGRGADTLTGGRGFDRFQYDAFSDSKAGTSYGIDLIKDFNPTEGDVVDLTALGTAILQPLYDPSFTGLQAVFKYAKGVTTLSYYNGSSTAVFQLKFTGNVTYSESFGGILPTPITVNGTDGNDTLMGGAGDHVFGFGGNDQIDADSSSHVFAGAGDDFIFMYQSTAGFIGEFDGGEGSDALRYDWAFMGDTLDASTGRSTDQDDNVLFTFTNIERFFGLFSSFIGTDAAEHAAVDDWVDWTVTVSAYGGDDGIWTGAGNDRITGGAGDDSIDATEGDDTAVFSGNYADYIITADADYGGHFATATVQQVGGGGDGTDTLTNVEFLEFADGTYEFATNTFTPNVSSLFAAATSLSGGNGFIGGSVGEWLIVHLPSADLFF